MVAAGNVTGRRQNLVIFPVILGFGGSGEAELVDAPLGRIATIWR